MKTIKEILQVLRDTRRLFGLAWQDSGRLMFWTGVVVIFASLMPFVQNFAIGQLLNDLVDVAGSGQIGSTTLWLLALVVGAGVVFATANTLQFFCKTVLYKKLFLFVTVLIHKKTAMLDIATHENPSRKDLLTKVQENAMWRAPDFMQRMTFLTQNILEVGFALVVISAADWRVGLFIALAALPRLWVDMRYNTQLWRVETDVSGIRREFWYSRWNLIDPRALTEVKLFQNVAYFVGLIRQHLGAVKEREIQVERKNVRMQLLALLLTEAATVTGIILFVTQTVQGSMEVGTLAFLLSTLAVFRFAFNSMSQNIGSQFQDGKFVRDMFEAFDLKPLLPLENSKRKTGLEQIREIEFDNVWFAYPDTDCLVLKGVNLRIAGGSTLGIVAENGSGKSTLAKLLCRIYDPTDGVIRINGIDIREFDIDYLQANVGVMLQEFGRYEHLDVERAVKLGRTNNGNCMSEVVRATENADARDFVERLPARYGTKLGSCFEGGVELSGGQYQKLAIARMCYRSAKIAIYDEPTSAIDGEAEARIFDALLNNMPGCTKLLISHRFYTLQKADCICVLSEGQVVECGSHKELMRHGGIYAERYQAQADEYHESDKPVFETAGLQ